MKKLLLIMMSTMLIVVLAACGGAKDAEDLEPNQEFVVKASNFDFEPSVITVKKGDVVKMSIENVQGNHGFEIKEYKVNVDSRNNSKVFVADKVGEFDMKCSIQCGPGHNDMVAKFIVEE